MDKNITLGAYTDKFQYVTRRNKGRKKRKSKLVQANDQNSENTVTVVESQDDIDETNSNQTNDDDQTLDDSEEDFYKMNDRISIDAQMMAKPQILEPEEIVECKQEKELLPQISQTQLEENSAEEPTSELNTYNIRALSKHAETYELEKFEKNVLIIFNQDKVEGYMPRHGTGKDVEALEGTFKRFGFEVTEYKDLTKKDIFDTLETFFSQDFTDYGCVGIAVLTHGSNLGLLRAKDQQYSEIEIINHFKVHNKPSLVTKPKFLIIQACRGTEIIPGAAVMFSGKIRTDMDSSKEPYILPVEADLLILHSSYVGSPSHRDELYGSWFIQSLCNKINQLAATHDLESIITEVKRDVAIDKEHEVYNRKTLEMQVNKQMPVMTSTLIRKLYLKKFRDPPLLPLVTLPDAACACRSASSEVLDSAPPSTPMLVQFGPCSCFLEHFEYMKNCLGYFVEDHPKDEIAVSYLELAETLEDGVKFNAAKQKLAKAMCKHLTTNAKQCHYYKYLYFYKHF